MKAVAFSLRVAGAGLTALLWEAEALVVLPSGLTVTAVLQRAAAVSNIVEWSQAPDAAVLRWQLLLSCLHCGVFFAFVAPMLM